MEGDAAGNAGNDNSSSGSSDWFTPAAAPPRQVQTVTPPSWTSPPRLVTRREQEDATLDQLVAGAAEHRAIMSSAVDRLDLVVEYVQAIRTAVDTSNQPVVDAINNLAAAINDLARQQQSHERAMEQTRAMVERVLLVMLARAQAPAP
ncbi:uncharacterized protein LOC135368593 [Ornithodoros turicata]|uniref:uncharacterized protein LOC135368593 n=1 Tax=Ornithodoros turicata TaxID=34597 RepID=UPI003139D5A8